MSLRDEAIVVMAVARAKRMNRKEWDQLTVHLQDVFREDVALCLDALLEFLNARANGPVNIPADLVAALRGTTEEPQ